MPLRQTIVTLSIFVLLTSCGTPSQPPERENLASDEMIAARQCYLATMQTITYNKKLPSGVALSAKDGAPADYFAFYAVSNGGNRIVKNPQEYVEYSTDPELVKDSNEGSFRSFLDECHERFPKSRPDNSIKLPKNIIDKYSLCFYSSNWILFDKSNDPIVNKAKNIMENYRNNKILLDQMSNDNNLNSQDKFVSFNASVLASSIKYGNTYSIVESCPEEL